jgi:hypothetical protein
MLQLLIGFTMIALGAILLLIHFRSPKAQKENNAFEIPYLKNGGIGFVIFGIYYLIRYLLN